MPTHQRRPGHSTDSGCIVLAVSIIGRALVQAQQLPTSLATCVQLKHGTADTAHKVSVACVAAEPHHGDTWQQVAKALPNAHQPVDVILRRVVTHMEKQPPSQPLPQTVDMSVS